MTWLAVIVAFVVGLLGTRLMRSFAPRVGLIDAPDGVRKLQTEAIPLGGGVAVFVATLAGAMFAIAFDPPAAGEFLQGQRAWWAFLAAAAILLVVGLLDDWYELIARYKLLGQILAAAVLAVGGDLMIRNLSAFGYGVALNDVTAGFVTVFFLIFAINSLNLLDGMDGLLGTVGVVVCIAMAGVAYMTGQYLPAAVALALAGGLLGFLRYNWPPASVYLGDCGSMLIGLVIGTLCIKASLKSHAVATLVPICVLVLPFLDTTAAVIRRKLSGRSMAHADREHLHHMLLKRGLSVRSALVVVAGLGLLAGAGAVASVYFASELIGIGVSLGIIIVLLVTGLFGGNELKLVSNKLSSTALVMTGRRSSSRNLAAAQAARPASALPPAPSP